MGIAIAGFHRSGTSAVTQHLTHAGMNPGGELMHATDFNPYGHFEDWGPVRFHDAVLNAAGLDWASVTWEEIPVSAKHKYFMSKYCGDRAAQTSDWGFKDPRICQFLDRWMLIDPTLKALIIYRSPVECSWSIYRRTVREFVRKTHNPRIASRIMNQRDQALALWVTHNKKLLEVARQFPDRTVVVSHAGFASGFNVSAALRERFGLGLTPVDVMDTFREDAVTRKVASLPVSDTGLRNEAIGIWNNLERLNLANGNRGEDAGLPFRDDPEGLLLANQLLLMEVSEMRQVQDMNGESALIGDKLRAARKVARKLRRWPFSMFFTRSKKYRRLIEEILS